MEIDAFYAAAFCQHIEIPFPKVRSPFSRLFLIGSNAGKHQIGVCLSQDIDLLGGIEPHAEVASCKKLCHSILPQRHDLLEQFQLHFAAVAILFIKAPFEANWMLSKNGTAA